jgi:hypothetical protein
MLKDVRTISPVAARLLLSALVLVTLVVVPPQALPAPAPGGSAIAIEAKPVPLNVFDADQKKVGRLLWRGGLELRSSDPRFGGLSGLLLDPACRSFVTVSDDGWWITGMLGLDKAGNLASVRNGRIRPLMSTDGLRPARKTMRDAEALTRSRHGTIVALEHAHRVLAYREPFASPSALAMPSDLVRAPANGGIEALATLADGSLLAISEELAIDGGVVAWVGTPGHWRQVRYPTSDNFKPTGATTLPNGDVLVLERRFPPVGARLRILPAGSLAAGRVPELQEIARLEGALTVDNLEGIDVCFGPGRELRVVIVADDNFNFLQRTLLLMFALGD